MSSSKCESFIRVPLPWWTCTSIFVLLLSRIIQRWPHYISYLFRNWHMPFKEKVSQTLGSSLEISFFSKFWSCCSFLEFPFSLRFDPVVPSYFVSLLLSKTYFIHTHARTHTHTYIFFLSARISLHYLDGTTWGWSPPCMYFLKISVTLEV